MNLEVLMLELRLIGVHDDGENLVLESADGTRFLLPIDANLRTSITKARRIQPLRRRSTKGSFGHRRSEERRVGKECRSRWSSYH